MLRPRHIVVVFIGGAVASWLWFAVGGIIATLTLVPAYAVATRLFGPISATGLFMEVVVGLSHALAALALAILLAYWLRGPWLGLFIYFLAGLAVGCAIQLALFQLDSAMLLELLALPALWAPLIVTALSFFLASWLRVSAR